MTFDLDAVVNDGKPFEFTFGGEQYTFPADPPLEVPPLLRDGKDVEAMQALLGDEQWARIVDSTAVLGVKGAKALLDAYNTHLGLASGGSSASTGS